MKFGLTELFGNLRIFKGANYVGFAPPASVGTSFTFTLPDALPAGGTKLVGVDTSGNWVYQDPSAGGGGTVTSVALGAPAIFSVSGSPITGAGTLTLGFATGQAANQFLASPNGTTGAVSMRAIAWGDVSSLVGTSGTSFAVGNDGRFHTQGTDTGTTQTAFLIDSGGTPVRLKTASGGLQIRNNADNAFADFTAGNVTISGDLTVSGTTTTVNSETMTVNDNVVVLNNNVTAGTPTENGGIEVRRGASSSATVLWDETTDEWMAGTVAAPIAIARAYRTTFTNATLSVGTLTLTHGLGKQDVTVTVIDNNNKQIIPDEITFTNSTSLVIDLTTYGTLSGTWRVVVAG